MSDIKELLIKAQGLLKGHFCLIFCSMCRLFVLFGFLLKKLIQTTLLSMFYGSEVKTMMPKLHSENYEGLELIRPLYLIKENAITAKIKLKNGPAKPIRALLNG